MPTDPRILLSNQQPPAPDFAETYGRLMQLRAQQQQMDMRGEEHQARLAQAQMQMGAQQQEAATQQEAMSAIEMLRNGQGRELLSRIKNPQAAMAAEAWLDKRDALQAERKKIKQQDLKDRAQLIRETGYDPEIMETVFGDAAVDMPEVAQVWEKFKGNPEGLQRLVDHYAGVTEKQPGTREVKTVNEQGQEVIKIVPDVAGAEFPVPPPKEQPPVSKDNPRWVWRNGAPVFLKESEIQPGDRPSEPEQPSKADKERIVQVAGPNGTPIWVRESEAVGKPAAQASRSVTGQERKVLGFYNRAKEALDNLEPIEPEIAKAGTLSQLQLQHGGNMLQTSQQQLYRQAQRAFTEARLRKESGAAVPPNEYTNDAKTYFAQPGDSDAVIKQKREARQVVLDGIAFESGRAFEEYYGEQPTRGAKADGAADKNTPKPTHRFNPATGKVEAIR